MIARVEPNERGGYRVLATLGADYKSVADIPPVVAQALAAGSAAGVTVGGQKVDPAKVAALAQKVAAQATSTLADNQAQLKNRGIYNDLTGRWEPANEATAAAFLRRRGYQQTAAAIAALLNGTFPGSGAPAGLFVPDGARAPAPYQSSSAPVYAYASPSASSDGGITGGQTPGVTPSSVSGSPSAAGSPASGDGSAGGAGLMPISSPAAAGFEIPGIFTQTIFGIPLWIPLAGVGVWALSRGGSRR